MIITGIIIICIVGTLLHFTYELSGHNKVVAIFSAVNESTWEHIKICMTPTILWSLLYIGKPNYIIALSLTLFTIILLIPLLFYTYTLFTKKSILFIDVICFYITVITSQLVFKYFINMDTLQDIYKYLSIILLVLELFCYMYLTFYPLKNFIFKDPITDKYGVEGHPCEHHHHEH